MKGKRIVGLLLVVSLAASFVIGITSFAGIPSFSDTPSWCAEAVDSMADQGILSGFQDGLFHPERNMTRAQTAKVLQLIYAKEIDEDFLNANPENKKFLDEAKEVNPDNWATVYIATAYAIGVRDYGYEYSEWAKPITRYEMAHMAAQYARTRLNIDGEDMTLPVIEELKNYIGDWKSFEDRPYAKDVLWMYSEGFVNGSDSRGTFNPDSTLTRAQACAILYRIQNEDARVSVTWNSHPILENTVGFQGGEYAPGSVYGPSLTQTELNQVKEVVQQFVEGYITTDMSDYEKVELAQEFLNQTCSYAANWSKNRANTAWGALIYHEAQCSGYARAMKALCDGMGVGCYYVHANETASNPSHQLNIVEVDGNWYIVDPQLNDTMGSYWPAFLLSEQAYRSLTGVTWDSTGLPSCPKSYSK